MSIFLPYSPVTVLNYLTTLFNLDLSQLTNYEITQLTILSNIYFFLFWFVLIYFSLKIFNRIWERLF